MLTTIDCFGVTDIGKKRPSNQDHFLIPDLNKSMQVQQTSLDLHNKSRLAGGSQGKLLVVADGMGGHAGGERASAWAVSSSIESSKWSHVLWNYLGGDSGDAPKVEVHNASLRDNDNVLLCTDGLFRGLSVGDIVTIIGQETSSAAFFRRLVDDANTTGGSDNITIVVARIGAAEPTKEVTIVEEATSKRVHEPTTTQTADTVDLVPASVRQ